MNIQKSFINKPALTHHTSTRPVTTSTRDTMLPVAPTQKICNLLARGAKKILHCFQRKQPQNPPVIHPSMEELRRVAESRIETALHIDHRDPREFATEVQDQQQTLWPWGTDGEDYSKEAILNIMGAILAGHYKYSTGPTIRQLALHQLDKDMVSDNQSEETWQWWYQHKYMDLVLDGKGHSEEAEMLNIMIDTLDLYRQHGVFQYGHYCPWKAHGADGRLFQPMKQDFASGGNRRLRRKERFVSEQHNWPQPITLF